MKNQTELLELFNSLNIDEQESILNKLMQEHELQMPVIEKAKHEALLLEDRKPCPYCQSKNIYKRGIQNKTKMYSCKDCKKWYSQSTGTPLWDIKLKTKWSKYLRCMSENYSLRKSAKEVGICLQTSFDWRHKILASLNTLVPKTLSGIVECDELEISINNKGDRDLKRAPRKRSSGFNRNEAEEVSVVQIVTAIERKGEKMFKVVETKRLTEENIKEALDGKLQKDTLLITDKHPSYKAFGKTNIELTHKAVKAKEHVDTKDKRIHLQTVNQTHKQIRLFISKFNGVNTKYLQNYLNWYAYEGKIQENKAVIKQWVLTGIMSPGAYHLFWLFKQNVVNIRT
jgi:transposase-like protein